MYRLLALLALGLCAPLAQAQTTLGPDDDLRLHRFHDGDQERTGLLLEFPGPSDVTVRLSDREGQLVAAPDHRSVDAGKLLVPLALEGLTAGTYYVEVSASDQDGAAWESRRPVVVR